MSYKDVRECIQRVDQMGELKEIEGADWDMCSRAEGGSGRRRRDYPALLERSA